MKRLLLLLTIVLLAAACANSSALLPSPPPSTPIFLPTATPQPAAELAPAVTVWPTFVPEPTWTPIPAQTPPSKWRLVPDAEVGYAAPDVILTTLDGDTFGLRDLRGKVVLIDFWGIGCPGCSISFSGMEQAFHKYSRDDLVILGINSFNTPEEIRQEAARLGVTFPMISDADQTLFYDEFGAVITPSFVFIDREGLVQIISISPLPPDYIEAYIVSLL